MFKRIYFSTDIKRLLREPMMALLFAVPLFLPVLFRLMLDFLVPWISTLVPFDITLYLPYVLTFVLLLNPGLLGMVMGFMMLDDKDGRIVELMRVTPLGRGGYMAMRLSFVFVSTVFYTIVAYLIMGLYIIPIPALLYIAILLSVYGSFVGMILFLAAGDKVKGLTFAKALNLLILFAFADLAGVPWMSAFSSLFPTYWITRIIMQPASLLALILGAAVHAIWFALVSLLLKRKQS